MNHYFKTILLPVDLAGKTNVSIKKALSLAESGTNIVLLYVHKYSRIDFGGMIQRYFFDATMLPEYMQLDVKLNHWKDSIQKINKDVTVSTLISIDDSVQKGIEKVATEIDADLIIISKKSHYGFFLLRQRVDPCILAKQTRATVLSFKRADTKNKSSLMILPLTSETIVEKKDLLLAISRKFPLTIPLVAFNDREDRLLSSHNSSLLQIYKWLKDRHCLVEYKILSGANKMRSLFKYAERMNTDIILVNPENEI